MIYAYAISMSATCWVTCGILYDKWLSRSVWDLPETLQDFLTLIIYFSDYIYICYIIYINILYTNICICINNIYICTYYDYGIYWKI